MRSTDKFLFLEAETKYQPAELKVKFHEVLDKHCARPPLNKKHFNEVATCAESLKLSKVAADPPAHVFKFPSARLVRHFAGEICSYLMLGI